MATKNSERAERSRVLGWDDEAIRWAEAVVTQALHSGPGLNVPFADRLLLALVGITIQNGDPGSRLHRFT